MEIENYWTHGDTRRMVGFIYMYLDTAFMLYREALKNNTPGNWGVIIRHRVIAGLSFLEEIGVKISFTVGRDEHFCGSGALSLDIQKGNVTIESVTLLGFKV